MLDAWHDLYHNDDPDYINCPYCQDEMFAMVDKGLFDRLEDKEI